MKLKYYGGETAKVGDVLCYSKYGYYKILKKNKETVNVERYPDGGERDELCGIAISDSDLISRKGQKITFD